MSLVPGTKLGPYEIMAPLGAGGMGEVYRAKDTRLDRTVAIKILPQQVSNDPTRKQRFEREAKTISGLNHPHICVLHDIGSQDGVDYLVMECMEGETLAARLQKGALPLEQLLKYGSQIADALDKAHRAGIVHRDLKPGNIMLTASGAKLLDFGLAKPLAPVVSGVTLTAAVPSSPVTQEGTIVGTFQYMSPEQVEGKEVDGRSDIFSLGAVLYEMVTGKRAFEGKSQLSVASAILEKDPEPIRATKPVTPPALEHAIQRCLVKDPEERWQVARDLAMELNWIAKGNSQADAAPVHIVERKRTSWLTLGLAGLALAVGLIAGTLFWQTRKEPESTMRFLAPFSFPARDMAIAPNSHTVAIVGYQEAIRKNVIWLYELGAAEPKSLPETEGADFPFWSPDGKSLAFFADGKLKRAEIAGGPVQTICEAPTGRGGTWNKDGVIVFTPSGQLIDGLYEVSASGGTPKRITLPDQAKGENSHRWPQFLPDGKHFLYLAANVSGQTEPDAIYVGALGSDEKKFLVKSTANASYVAAGYLLYCRENTLFAQRFDADRLELSGEATPVLTSVQFLPRIAYVVYAAGGGTILAQKESVVSLSTLDWFDRAGKFLTNAGKPDNYSNVTLSPNGKLIALDKTDPGTQNADVWIYDAVAGSHKRLTFDPAIDAMPVWSPDGSQVVFASSREHLFNLYVKKSDGSQEEKAVYAQGNKDIADLYPGSWSPDGKFVLYTHSTELRVMDMTTHQPRPFLNGNFVLRSGQISPDGKWAAYASNETGKWEIYVTSFPEARGKWQVSSGGGTQPKWRGDTKELYFMAPDAKIMAAPVSTRTSFEAGTPVALFQANPQEMVATSEQNVYDVSRDGQKFLVNTKAQQANTQPMSIILNWTASLKKAL